MSMTNYPYPTSFLSDMPAWPVTESCKPYAEMDSEGFKDLKEIEPKMAAILNASRYSIGIYYNYTGQQPCFNIDTNETPDLEADGWYVLACNQMAMTMAPDGINDFFLPRENTKESRDAYEVFCKNQWNMKPQWNWVTEYFGGKD
jgi:lysosomal Pro-X carboxypeptidase